MAHGSEQGKTAAQAAAAGTIFSQRTSGLYPHLTPLILVLNVMVFIHQSTAHSLIMNKLVKKKGTSTRGQGKGLLPSIIFLFIFLLPFLTHFSHTVPFLQRVHCMLLL